MKTALNKLTNIENELQSLLNYCEVLFDDKEGPQYNLSKFELQQMLGNVRSIRIRLFEKFNGMKYSTFRSDK